MTINIQEDNQHAVKKEIFYKISFAFEGLEYQAPITIDDPMPTARQLLQAVNVKPLTEHLLFQVLSNGNIREIEHDDTVDLREQGVEKFIVFRSDRSFYFEVDGNRFEWGTSIISGLNLKKLAGVDPEIYNVWLEVHGAEDELIENNQKADLNKKGVERFFTCIKETNEG